MQQSVKAGTFENEAGDRVILNYHTDASRTYEEAGYKLVENSDEVTASAFTTAQVLTTADPADGEASEKARSKDPEDAPADPSAVAYPAGQLPETTVVSGAGSHDVTPISDARMQDSQPKGGGGSVPLTEFYETPPTEGRNPSPEARAAQREANAADGIVDPRGVHEKTQPTPKSADAETPKSDVNMTDGGGDDTSAQTASAEGTESAVSAGGESAPTPNEGTAVSGTVVESQGANSNSDSQGTSRPSARSRSKS